MRIKFLANGILDDFDPTGSGTDGIMVINPAYWMMKHYHTLHGRHQPEWLLQNFLAHKTSQQQVDELIQDGVRRLRQHVEQALARATVPNTTRGEVGDALASYCSHVRSDRLR